MNEINVIPQIKEMLLNRSKLINKLRLECSYARIAYKKVLKIISNELDNPYVRIYTRKRGHINLA